MKAAEIVSRLLDHPGGATPERLAKAMALATRSRRASVFHEVFTVECQARGVCLEHAAIEAAHQLRLRTLEAGELAAQQMSAKTEEEQAEKKRRLAFYPAARAAHLLNYATWRAAEGLGS